MAEGDAASVATPPIPTARGSRGRREREFRRYAEAVLNISSVSDAPAGSSTDVPLTAFAQLVALRLNVKRVLVSLFDHSSQYILAEATQTLSLLDDADHDANDEMYFGSSVLPRSASDWNTETLSAARKLKSKDGSHGEDAALILTNLEHDDKHSRHPYVVGAPFVRSYIGVPLLAPTGYAIGTLAVLDDNPRTDGFPASYVKFMRNVAVSIMSHLDLARIQCTHRRGTRMVHGLSRFMEGKGSLDGDDSNGEEDPDELALQQGTQTSNLGASAQTHALNIASNAERMHSAYDSFFDASTSELRTSKRAGRPHTDRRGSSFAIQGEVAHRPATLQANAQDTSTPTAAQLQEDIVSRNVSQAFQRAANLIQQAMDMAGVLFLDASAGEFGSLKSRGTETASTTSTTSSGSSPDTRSSGGETATESDATYVEQPGEGASPAVRLKPCRYLSAAYHYNDDGSSKAASHQSIPEKFLRSLLRRHQHGRIFNFSDHGLLSSDDYSDSGSSPGGSMQVNPDGTAAPIPKHKAQTQSDAAKLLKIFPGVRSFAIMPMWQADKGRFLAGAVVWSYDQTRLFSFQDDLNYLTAFCDVIMAEIGRVETQAEVKAKTSFISSISHELRSPLHGILGSVEFLSDPEADDPATRSQMISMIDTCGRSLLDIINNLLEHAHASSTDKPTAASRHRVKRKISSSTSSQPVHDLAILAEEVMDGALWYTPEPSVGSRSDSNSSSSHQNEDPIKVILDLDIRNLGSTGWNFHVNAGAFRRILMNLTSNAIKYTDYGGYLKCTLSATKPSPDGRTIMVEINFSDSGRGMSEEYLRNGLWKAFNQVDSHSSGTGLGMNLVRALVEEMNGAVDVQSAINIGTTIKISLPLTPGPSHYSSGDPSQHTADSKQIQSLDYRLLGFDSPPDHASRPADSIKMQSLAVDKVCKSLGLRKDESSHLKDGQHPHLYIMTEKYALATARAAVEQTPYQDTPCIILCDSIASSRRVSRTFGKRLNQIVVASQPLGPRQLLRAVTTCLHQPVETNVEQLNLEAGIDSDRYYSEGPTPTSVTSENRSARSGMDWDNAEPVESRATDPHMTRILGPKAEEQTHRLEGNRPSVDRNESSILLVDDNPVNMSLLQRYMKKLGRQFIGATNGLEALDAYSASLNPSRLVGKELETSEEHPVSPLGHQAPPTARTRFPVAVVFMDITMPVMDGLESARRIRAFERQHGLKNAMIVALTALASPQARQEAFSSGVDLFLTKPVRFRDIEQMFKDWGGDGGSSSGGNSSGQDSGLGMAKG